MKKIFLMFVAVFALAACDPTHEDIGNASHITVDELKAQSSVTVDKAASGKNGNVITCSTSAPVNAKWNIGGKEFISNSAKKKMKLGIYTVVMTAVCPDGTQLTADFPVTCEEITDPLQKIYIYGGDPEKEPPFKPAAWQGAEMRFDVSDATPDCNIMVHNGWWSATYISDMTLVNGPNELQITEQIANDCAKGKDGKDLQLLLKSGSFTLNSVYYEE